MMKLEPVIKGDSRFNTAVALYHGLGKFVFLDLGLTPQVYAYVRSRGLD